MRVDIKKLSIKDKIKLFKELYQDITAHGHPEDVHLAHVNEYERKLLIKHGGCGTVNEETGLTQYFGGGGSGGTTTPDTTTTFAREAPEIEARKLALFDTAANLTAQPINIPSYEVAAPTALEQGAFALAGEQGVGTAAVDQGIAATQAAQTAARAPLDVNAFLNPYSQFAIDEINRQAAMGQDALSANAVRSGAFGGGREGVASAELERARLGQIGQLQAGIYGNALTAAMADRQFQTGAEQGIGQQFAGLGAQQQAMQAQDIQQQMAVGGQQRGIAQAALDRQRQTDIARAYEPYQRIESQKGIMTALPTASSQVTATSAPGANPYAQTIGQVGKVAVANRPNLFAGTGVMG